MKTAALATGGRYLPAIAAYVTSRFRKRMVLLSVSRGDRAASGCLRSAPGSLGFDTIFP